MRKIGLSLVLAGILGATNAVAEESGVFVGVQAGYGSLKVEVEGRGESGETTASGARYGLVAGYKQFFTPEFGARYYAMVDLGSKYSKEFTVPDEESGGSTKNKLKSSTYNISANADALYNFLSNDALDFGVFAGLSLGYANHSKINLRFEKQSGFDLGINFGLRANIAANHGVELTAALDSCNKKKRKARLVEAKPFKKSNNLTKWDFATPFLFKVFSGLI